MPTIVVRATFLLALFATALEAQVGPVVDISGRPACDTSAYQDVDMAFDQLFDSTVAAPLLFGFRREPPDAYTVAMVVSHRDSLDSLLVAANNHSLRERQDLGARLAPFARVLPPGRGGRTYTVHVSPGPDSLLSVGPGGYTCYAELRDVEAVSGRYSRAVNRLRRQGRVAPGSAGHVVVGAFLSNGGDVDSVWVMESSGQAAVDSAAVAALRKARFHPAVIGRRAVEAAVQQRFTY